MYEKYFVKEKRIFNISKLNSLILLTVIKVFIIHFCMFSRQFSEEKERQFSATNSLFYPSTVISSSVEKFHVALCKKIILFT